MVENGYSSSFMQEASARGFIFQCTDPQALDEAMAKGPVAAYIGFDPTADSLHVGSLIQIMMLRLLQKCHTINANIQLFNLFSFSDYNWQI